MAALPLVMLRAPAESVALNAPVLLCAVGYGKSAVDPEWTARSLGLSDQSALTDEGRPGVGVAGAGGLIEDYRSAPDFIDASRPADRARERGIATRNRSQIQSPGRGNCSTERF